MNTLSVSFFDRHTHGRNLPFSQVVVPIITKHTWGALAMPNTSPKLKTWREAAAYKAMLQSLSPPDYTWILTCYLTDNTDPDDLEEGFENGTWQAAKLYPMGMTTNSDEGVSDVRKLNKVLQRMAKINMSLLIHGEKADADTHPDYAEGHFMTDELPHLVSFGGPIIIEHVSAGETALMVAKKRYPNIVGATVTPQHLLFGSEALSQTTRFDPVFKRGGMSAMFCMPTLKMPTHRQEILKAIRMNPEMFGAGSDLALHKRASKLAEICACGCTTPRRVEMYATAFDEAGMLHLLPGFLGKNLLPHYGLTPREDHLVITRRDCDEEDPIMDGVDQIISMSSGKKLPWICEDLAK